MRLRVENRIFVSLGVEIDMSSAKQIFYKYFIAFLIAVCLNIDHLGKV
jgi:hypothetical protein